MRRVHLWTILAALAWCGCEPAQLPVSPVAAPFRFARIDWRPRSVIEQKRLLGEARPVGEDDLPLIAVEGARVLGTLSVVFPASQREAGLEALRRSAAKRGATHLLVIRDEETERVETTIDEDAQRAKAIATALESVGAAMAGEREMDRLEARRARRGPEAPPVRTTVTTLRAISAMLIRMPEARWGELPPELQPDTSKPIER